MKLSILAATAASCIPPQNHDVSTARGPQERSATLQTPNQKQAKMTPPLPDHDYHVMSDAELSRIIKEASEAAATMRGASSRPQHREYLKQVDDACIILNYRAREPQMQPAYVPSSQQRNVRTHAARPDAPKTGLTDLIVPQQTQVECPVCKAKAMAIAQREQRKQAIAQRKLEMIKRIEALIAALSKEDYARCWEQSPMTPSQKQIEDIKDAPASKR
jgi:hypothetical protein